MNALSYRCTEDNGLSFELRVDGRALGEWVGARDWAIPFWIIVDDLPHWPPHGPSDDPEIRIVCCCSCGEYGCGHTQCRVLQSDDEVVFWGFDFDVSPVSRAIQFRFTAANYQAVVAEIIALARAQPRHG